MSLKSVIPNLVAAVGVSLLMLPLLRHLTFRERLGEVDSPAGVVATVLGVTGGFVVGCVGVMLLAYRVDGCEGGRRLLVLFFFGVMGILWMIVYPGGWLLGVPMVGYALLRAFRRGTR